MMTKSEWANGISISALTHGPHRHMFGYYGITPDSPDGRFHLALETDFDGRRPNASDHAEIGLVEVHSGEFKPLARTSAFNFQQGSMLHWIDAGQGLEVSHNDWLSVDPPLLGSRAIALKTGAKRTFDHPIAAVSPSRDVAMGINFVRNAILRPVTGYALARPQNPASIQPRPDDDGLFRIDLRTGRSQLVVSLAQIAQAAPQPHVMEGPMWIDHVAFNPDGSRLLMIARIRRENGWYSSLWTLNPDGSKLSRQIDFGNWISHFTWIDAQRLIVTTDAFDGVNRFCEFTDNDRDLRPFGEGLLPHDGHPTLSPDGRWLVTDATIGADRMARLLMFDMRDKRRIEIGAFHHDPVYQGDIRCDLHPRWRADGRSITFDSVHEGTRQIYLADLTAVVGS